MDQIETTQTNDEFTPAWIQYEQLRLARLQQQRQRMQSMKEVIEKYSGIIRQLEAKNNDLVRENQQYKRDAQRLFVENQEIRYKNQELTRQLSKQLATNKNLQNLIRRVKEDISILTAERENNQQFGNKFNHNSHIFNYQVEYEVLQQLYEDIKKEYYCLTDQNQQLRNQIHKQSNRNSNIRFTHENIEEFPTEGPSQKSRDYPNYTKINELKYQIKKQDSLIEKFRQTDKQQQELIQLMKNNMNKVCACHTGGVMSSKKIASIKNIQARLKTQIQ